MSKLFSFSISSPKFVSRLLDDRRSDWSEVVSQSSLICVSLRPSDSEHFKIVIGHLCFFFLFFENYSVAICPFVDMQFYFRDT